MAGQEVVSVEKTQHRKHKRYKNVNEESELHRKESENKSPFPPVDENCVPSVVKNTKGVTLLVPIKVYGRETMAVVDTAAQVTVFSKTFMDTLKVPLPVSEHIILNNAEKNCTMSGQKIKDLMFRVGQSNFRQDVFVAPIRDHCLLGMDFLLAHNGKIDLSLGEVNIDGEIIPATLRRDATGNTYRISRVFVKKRQVIPPGTFRNIPVQLDDKPETDFIISPMNREDLFIPNTLVGGESNCTLRVVNFTQKYILLKPEFRIGTAVELDKVLDDESEKADNSVGNVFSLGSESKSQELPEHLVPLLKTAESVLNPGQMEQLKTLLIEFSDVFSQNDLDLGCFKDIQHRVKTVDEIPVTEGLRRTPICFQDEERKVLENMLEMGVIQPSCSEWAAAPVLVRKKDGSVRYCIDYRKLNNKTVKDAFPIPLIDECIDQLADVAYFSTLDMSAGYWQLEIHPEDRHKTAFVTKYGLYEHVRMAFGLTGSPATFQRAVNLILHGLTWKEVLAYLDDIIILGTSFEDHLQNIREVFTRFRQNNLKFKARKCQLFQTETPFLGRIVGRDGIRIPVKKIEAIQKWPRPMNTKQIESFLGLANYHREFIHQFSEKAASLYALTGPKAEFVWGEEQESAFCQLKQALASPPVLALPNNRDMFVLDTDASDISIGAELSQVQDGQERTIAYGSHIMSPIQRRMCTTRKEMLSLVMFTRQFRHYLLGRKFVVRTDHASLVWLMRFKNLEGQLARWMEELSQYDMQIQHRAGKKHINADALSRIPNPEQECSEYRAGHELESLPCGGCKYCQKVHFSWRRFEDEVDDIVPLSVRLIQKVTREEEIQQVRIASENEGTIDRSWQISQNNLWDEDLNIRTLFENPNRQSLLYLPAYDFKELRQMQLKDTDVRDVILWLESKVQEPELLSLASPTTKRLWTNRSQLEFRENVLFYVWEGTNGQKSRRLVVPEQLKAEVLRMSHDSVFAGHMGKDKTLQKVRNSFFWPGMSLDCQLYVLRCGVCNKNKKANFRPKAGMVNYQVGAPLDRVHLDILGPLFVSEKGNRYILLIVDQFTKWVEICPIPEQSAETVVKQFFESFIVRLGVPLEVHTDQGRNFEGNLFKAFCKLMETTKTRTTPYRPSANGQVERYNRTILQMMRCFLKGRQNQWDNFLPALGMALRATTNRSTGFTANMLMLGREVQLPMDVILGISRANKETSSPSEFLCKLTHILHDTHMAAREKLQQVQRSQKKMYDFKLKEHLFERGDLVYLLDSASKVGQNKKLQPVYQGPYMVVECISPILYRIQKRKKQVVLHHDRLKPCSDSIVPMWLRRKRHELLDLDETIAYDVLEQDEGGEEEPQNTGNENNLNSNVAITGPPAVTGTRPLELGSDMAGGSAEHTRKKGKVNLSPKKVVEKHTRERGKNKLSPERVDTVASTIQESIQNQVSTSPTTRTRRGRPIRQPAFLRDYDTQDIGD